MHWRGEDRHVLHGRSRWRRAGWATLVMGSMVWLGSVGSAAAEAKTWVGGGGSWHTRENWSPIGVPSPTDDAIIAAGNPSLSTADAAVGSINLTANLSVSGWTLTVGATASSTIAGTVSLASGNLRLNG